MTDGRSGGRTGGQADRRTGLIPDRPTARPTVRIRLSVLAAWLALATSAGCSREGVRPATESVAADTADQVMLRMATKITNDGVLRSNVEADTAYMYNRSQSTDLRHFTAHLLDEKGNLKSTLTADRGLYVTYANKLDARGNVVVTTVDGQKIHTEHLIYDKMANQVTIDTTFTYESKKGRLTGNCLKSDIDFINVTVCQPKGQQRGKGFLLPGQ